MRTNRRRSLLQGGLPRVHRIRKTCLDGHLVAVQSPDGNHAEHPRNDVDFRIDILKASKAVFVSHMSTRDVCPQVEGYVTLISMVVGLEDAFSEDAEHEDDVLEWSKALELPSNLVLAILMHDHYINYVGYDAFKNALLTDAWI